MLSRSRSDAFALLSVVAVLRSSLYPSRGSFRYRTGCCCTKRIGAAPARQGALFALRLGGPPFALIQGGVAVHPPEECAERGPRPRGHGGRVSRPRCPRQAGLDRTGGPRSTFEIDATPWVARGGRRAPATKSHKPYLVGRPREGRVDGVISQTLVCGFGEEDGCVC